MSDPITRAADEVAQRQAEGDRMTLKFLQGQLAGICMRDAREAQRYGNLPPQLPPLGVKIDTVEVPTDDEGNYQDHFVVVTASGARIKITLELEDR